MGKKTKSSDTDTDKSSEYKKNTDTPTDTDTTESDNDPTENKSSFLNKFNKLDKKAKLYLGIFLVLLLAGLFMWYKNRSSQSSQNQNTIINDQQITNPINNTNPTAMTHLSPQLE